MIPDSIKNLLTARGWQVCSVFRDGPRYWVARLTSHGSDLIFKAVINDATWTSRRTGQILSPTHQLRQEAELFKTIMPDQPLIEYDPDGRWLTRPFFNGMDMAAGPSPFIFKDEFFEPTNYRAVLDYIEYYQSLTPLIRQSLSENPLAGEHALEAKLFAIDFINPTEVLAPYVSDARKYLGKLHEVHDRNMDTLSHGQLYPPHILIQDGRVELIDWESSSLNNRLADYTALWIRGYDKPQWQQQLLDELHQRGAFDFPNSQELWDMEVLLASSGNLNYLDWSELESEEVKRSAVPSLKRNIENILGGQ